MPLLRLKLFDDKHRDEHSLLWAQKVSWLAIWMQDICREFKDGIKYIHVDLYVLRLMKRSKQNTTRGYLHRFLRDCFFFMTTSASKDTIKTANIFKVSPQVVGRQSIGYPSLKSRIEAASEGPRVNFDKNKWA